MKFSLKPVFIGWITLLQQLPLQLFFTVWCGGFFGGMGKSLGILPMESQAPFVFFGALAFFGVPLVAYIGKKLNYARTEYSFSDDQLDFEEGFFTISKKLIKYKDIKEVTLRKGILQKSTAWGRFISRRSRPAPRLRSIRFMRSASAMCRPAESACATFPIPTKPTKRSRLWWNRTTLERAACKITVSLPARRYRSRPGKRMFRSSTAPAPASSSRTS